jgi:hypothetical protein
MIENNVLKRVLARSGDEVCDLSAVQACRGHSTS